MKKLLLVLFAVVLLVSSFGFTAFADEAVEVTDAGSADADSKSADTDDMDVELNFQADGFARNLKYMGLGMLGIFVVVGIVILITFGLNAVTTKKK